MKRLQFFLSVSALVSSITFLSSCKKEELSVIPSLVTMPALSISTTFAVSGGSIISNGGATITERGVCWSTAPNPTTSDKFSVGDNFENFFGNLDHLVNGTEYHVRAYAKNSIGTAYGNEIIITTLSSVPANGLVGWWQFNGNANDDSGNGYNGSVIGAASTSDRFGNESSAFFYDGVSDYISLPPDPVTTTDQYTFSIWVNPTTTPSYDAAVNVFVIGYPNSELDYGLTFDNHYSSSGVTGFIVGGYTSPSTGEATTTGVVPPANAWYHVVGVRTSTTASIYLNGVLVSSNPVTGYPVSYQCNSCVSYVGIRTNLIQPFNGIIDDLAVYNRALTAEEVAKIYNDTGF